MEGGMLSFAGSLRIYVAVEPCDMRKSFQGLSDQVTTVLKRDLHSGALFVFSNHRRNRLKILYWDRDWSLGFCAKRLERGTYSWPKGEEKAIELRPEALAMLTDGIELHGAKMRPWYDRGE